MDILLIKSFRLFFSFHICCCFIANNDENDNRKMESINSVGKLFYVAWNFSICEEENAWYEIQFSQARIRATMEDIRNMTASIVRRTFDRHTK